MGTEFWWIYDVLFAAVFIVCIYMGFKRGFLKSAVLVVGYIIAVIGAFFIAKAVSPSIYDGFVKDSVTSAVQTGIEKTDISSVITKAVNSSDCGVTLEESDVKAVIDTANDAMSGVVDLVKEMGSTVAYEDIKSAVSENIGKEFLSSITEYIPKETLDSILKNFESETEKINQTVELYVSGDIQSAAQAVEETVVRPIAMMLIELIIWLLAFVIIKLIVRLIAQLFGAVNAIPIAGQLNALLGGFLGAAQCLLIVFIAASVIKILITLTSGELMVINAETIADTKIFRLIYNLEMF